jgi:hypothetical protein
MNMFSNDASKNIFSNPSTSTTTGAGNKLVYLATGQPGGMFGNNPSSNSPSIFGANTTGVAGTTPASFTPSLFGAPSGQTPLFASMNFEM